MQLNVNDKFTDPQIYKFLQLSIFFFQPGNDSGCTAVVALIRGNKLYVANAGDSRCIVCREGKAIEMSAGKNVFETLDPSGI